MAHFRVKTITNGDENIYPNKFPTKEAAEDFLKNMIPATLIQGYINEGLIKIYQESALLDGKGKPMVIE